MGVYLGDLIKQARTGAGLTQDKLARKIGVDDSDISKYERGQAEPTQAQLKAIAKATGVTQASLLNAAKAEKEGKVPKKTTSAKSTATKTTTGKSTSGKTTASKSTTTKTTASKTTASKTTTAKTTTAKTTTAKSTTTKTAAEKSLLDAFRAASADQRRAALYILKGESNDLVDDIIRKHSGKDNGIGDAISDLLTSLFGGK